MGILSGLTNKSKPYDLHDIRDWDEDERGKGKIYDPKYIPEGGWDNWCEWAAEQGKMAHIIQSRAKNAMAFELVSDTPKVQTELDKTFGRLHFNTKAIDFFATRDVYGRCFIEPVWDLLLGVKKNELKKIKSLYPPSIKVFFDNEDDVKDLKDYLQDKKKYRDYSSGLKEGPGDNVIGFVQHWDKKDIEPEKDQSVFFMPDELIMILRHPSHRNPLGLALPKQNYVLMMNKLGIEKDQAIMAKRHGDPKHKFIIPHDLWDTEKDNVKKELKRGIRAGLDFFFRGRRKGDDGDRMDVSLVEPTGNPQAVIRAQEHNEDQFNAAMGWADSFTESKSSNRSVGTIQMAFFERNLSPERKIFEETFLDELIEPWLKAKGLPAGSVKFKFEDLTPEDKLEKAKIIGAVLPYLPEEVIRKFLEEMGYPISGGVETPDIEQPSMQRFSSQKGIPKPVIKTAKSSKEQFKEEIESMQEDIRDVLGL
ncbi:MAG: hypothetical protein JXQ82_07780 [Methanomicrobiaceae archaeon]|nr:hypothetical protein [Methanomicrobiaceae archaeon]